MSAKKTLCGKFDMCQQAGVSHREADMGGGNHKRSFTNSHLSLGFMQSTVFLAFELGADLHRHLNPSCISGRTPTGVLLMAKPLKKVHARASASHLLGFW